MREVLIEDFKQLTERNIPWNELRDKTFLITGATGLVGSLLVRCLLYANETINLNAKVYAVVRNTDKADRIFEDENGKTNKSLADVDGQLLMVSQFTLYANCKKGNRPSFTEAGEPHRAEELYEYMVAKAREQVPVVETGVFGAEMEVSLVNDGPFTVILEDL